MILDNYLVKIGSSFFLTTTNKDSISGCVVFVNLKKILSGKYSTFVKLASLLHIVIFLTKLNKGILLFKSKLLKL